MENVSGSGRLLDVLKDLKARGVPEEEYKRYADRYLEKKARLHGVPMVGSFELTPFCNLDCRMCYVHLNPQQWAAEKLLPAETWKHLIREARNAGMMKALVTGGECLTYPGFDEVFCYLREIGIAPSVLTNGVLMDEERIAFFRENRPSLIQISLYGSSEEAYERVTGHRVFERVYRNILAIRDAELPLSLAITPSAYMRGDTLRLLRMVDELKLPYIINAALKIPRDDTGRGREDLSIDEYIEMYRLEKELQHQELTPVDLAELPDANRHGKKHIGMRCGGGRSTFAILHNGNMCPCLSMDTIVARPLEVGFAEAWRQVNAAANSLPGPEECVGCVYSEQCVICPALHRDAPEGHCNPWICERTRRLISAGVVARPAGL